MAGVRKTNPVAAPTRPPTTLVLDNGGWTLKAGLVGEGGDIPPPRVIPNCIARDRGRKVYVGSELASCSDLSEMQFRRPVEKGYLVNWEVQREIWERELPCSPAETRLVLTEQPNGLPALQANCDQMVFEEFGFASYARVLGPTVNAYHDVQSIFRTTTSSPNTAVEGGPPAEIVLVVDTGYSHTTITPVFRGRALHGAVRRVDVGGKLLTNYLARLVSLRHFDVRNEAYIVNDMKEAACYVSLDFARDLEDTWKGTRGEKRPAAGIVKDYVLPDFHDRSKGVLREHDPSRGRGRTGEDVLTLRNERFAVPEVLFHPSYIGMRQPGLAEAIRQSLAELPVGLWPGLLANIVVVGGSSLFEGFVQRLQRELMPLVPDDCVVRVARPADPVGYTWYGAAHLARHGDVESMAVTREEYEEYGGAWVARKFSGLED